MATPVSTQPHITSQVWCCSWYKYQNVPSISSHLPKMSQLGFLSVRVHVEINTGYFALQELVYGLPVQTTRNIVLQTCVQALFATCQPSDKTVNKLAVVVDLQFSVRMQNFRAKNCISRCAKLLIQRKKAIYAQEWFAKQNSIKCLVSATEKKHAVGWSLTLCSCCCCC